MCGKETSWEGKLGLWLRFICKFDRCEFREKYSSLIREDFSSAPFVGSKTVPLLRLGRYKEVFPTSSFKNSQDQFSTWKAPILP